MGSEHTEVINDLKKKVRLLLSLYDAELKDKSKVQKEITELKEKIKSQETEIETLGKKYETLKLAKAFEHSTDDGKDAKVKINRIVREIDNCIALLNR